MHLVWFWHDFFWRGFGRKLPLTYLYRCASWFQGLFRVIESWGPRHCCKVSLVGKGGAHQGWWVRYPMRRSMGWVYPPDSSAFMDGRWLNFKSWHPWVLIGLYWLFLRMFFFKISTRRSTSDSFPHVFVCLWKRKGLYNSIHFTMFHNSIHFTLVNFVLWTVNSSATFFWLFFFPSSQGCSLSLLLVRQTLFSKSLLLASCQVVKKWFWLCSHRVFAADLRLQRFMWVELE